jgi:hypothetical protein
MIIKGWRHAPPSFNSFIDFEVVTNFCTRWRERIRVDEMKVQIRDLAEDSTWYERRPFHFLTSLMQENNYAQGSGLNPQISISLFNELDTERKNYAHELYFIF